MDKKDKVRVRGDGDKRDKSAVAGDLIADEFLVQAL
jgi:hypothetical protein